MSYTHLNQSERYQIRCLRKGGWLLEDIAAELQRALSGSGANALVDGALAQRLGALKSLRHTYLLKRFGGHKVWCVNLPMSFTDWPHAVLKGDLGQATAKLIDRNERFSGEQCKNLGNASQQALKWVHKSMLVASKPKGSKNFARLARWFADANSKDEDVIAAASVLNAG